MNISTKQIYIFITGFAVLAGLFYVASQYTNTPGESQIVDPTATPTSTFTPISSPTPTTNSNPVTNTTLNLYLIALGDAGVQGEEIGCEDSLVAIQKEVGREEYNIKSALSKLFSLENEEFYNALSQSELEVDSVEIEDGNATINLSGELVVGGVCDNPRIEQQITQTATQFPEISNVSVFINDESLKSIFSQR